MARGKRRPEQSKEEDKAGRCQWRGRERLEERNSSSIRRREKGVTEYNVNTTTRIRGKPRKRIEEDKGRVHCRSREERREAEI
jgi:hypothetical protein